jgi:3-oxoacyl-[acyl-carrier protein] reductase
MSTSKNKVVLITGAARGIGAFIASRFADTGYRVVINYAHGKDIATALVEEIIKKGGDAIALQADVSKPDQVKKLFDDSIAHYGKIDVLVNNAGLMITKLIKDLTDEDFTNQFEVNVRGTFNTLREAATRLADHGSIINFSSTNIRVLVPTYSIYSATKAAVEQFTRIFSKEIGARGINVNAVAPGPVNTELFTKGKSPEVIARFASMTAFNRIGEPGDITGVVLFLASDEAKWINGQSIGINGAMA